MTCPECTKDLTAYPCICGYEPNKTAALQHWIIQHCARPGCTTAIRTRNGLSESALVCKWCHATDQYGSPYAVYQVHRSHEETRC